MERREQVLAQCIPQPKLGSDASVEVAQDVEAISSFGSSSEAEQLLWLEVVEQRLVARCFCVVELIDNDYVEVFRVELGYVSSVQALHGSKDVLPLGGLVSIHPLLTKRAVLQRNPEGPLALLQDLLAVRNKEQAASVEFFPKVAVVDRGHHGLARTSRSNDQVAVVAERSLGLDLLQDSLLECARP